MSQSSKKLAALVLVAVVAIGAVVTVSLAAPPSKPKIQGVVAQTRALRTPSSGLMKAPNPKLIDKAQSLTAGIGTKHAMISAPSAGLVKAVRSSARPSSLLKGTDVKALRASNQLNSTAASQAQRAKLVKAARGKNTARPKR